MGKFGKEPRGWCSLVGRKGYGVGLWKGIRGSWEALRLERVLWLAMEEEQNLGMMIGVGMLLLRTLFRPFSLLLLIKRFGW